MAKQASRPGARNRKPPQDRASPRRNPPVRRPASARDARMASTIAVGRLAFAAPGKRCSTQARVARRRFREGRRQRQGAAPQDGAAPDRRVEEGESGAGHSAFPSNLFVIAAEIVVARRRGGGEAQRLGRCAERADLVRRLVVVDLDALQVGDQRPPRAAWACTVSSAISRSATTGFLSRSRSMVSSAPPEICRARWAESSTRSNRFGILSTQSSTVTRAMKQLRLT